VQLKEEQFLVPEFMKGSSVAGLKDDRIKYVIKAKGEEHL
jgi:hypothetical protein